MIMTPPKPRKPYEPTESLLIRHTESLSTPPPSVISPTYLIQLLNQVFMHLAGSEGMGNQDQLHVPRWTR